MNDEIKRIELQIAKCKDNLSNEKFLKKAPQNIILKEEQKIIDFESLLKILKKETENEINNFQGKKIGEFQVKDSLYIVILPNKKIIKEYNFLLNKFESIEKIKWYIEFLREKKNIFQEYSREWFDYIYNEDIKEDEIIELYNILNGTSKI